MANEAITLGAAVLLSLLISWLLFVLWRLRCVTKAHRQRIALIHSIATLEESEMYGKGPTYDEHIKTLMRFDSPWEAYGQLGERGKRLYEAGR